MVQCGAVWCSVVPCVAVRCSALQCVAVRCMALQCVAVCCSALHGGAVRCMALQCVAVCCRALQCVAVHESSDARKHEQSRVGFTKTFALLQLLHRSCRSLKDMYNSKNTTNYYEITTIQNMDHNNNTAS